MKQLTSLFYTGLLSLAMLASCSSDDSTLPTTTGGTTTGGSTPSSSSSSSGSVADIQSRGVLNVGVKNNVEGFGLQDTLTSQYSGLEIDIATLIADHLDVDVEFTTVTAATRTNLLDSGDIDCVLATFTITDERKQSWDFTTPYYIDAVTVLVELSSGITNLHDFDNMVVGVSSGSNSARSMVAAMVEEGIIPEDSFDPSTFDTATWNDVVSFRQYDDYPAISTALSAGEVAAFCVDKSILSIYNSASRSFIDNSFAPQEYGVATKKNSEFSDLCEELITTWLADDTIDNLIAEHGIT